MGTDEENFNHREHREIKIKNYPCVRRDGRGHPCGHFSAPMVFISSSVFSVNSVVPLIQ